MSDTDQLRAVEIFVSDPWEFGTEHGCGPFSCLMPAAPEKCGWTRALLAKPIVVAGKSCNVVWMKSRHVGGSLGEAFQGRWASANFVFSSDTEPDDAAAAGLPGPFAGIGHVQPPGQNKPM